eukprot:COSAG02_NODE_1004_length_15275_cov_11.955917_3_plen_95_part_00
MSLLKPAKHQRFEVGRGVHSICQCVPSIPIESNPLTDVTLVEWDILGIVRILNQEQHSFVRPARHFSASVYGTVKSNATNVETSKWKRESSSDI